VFLKSKILALLFLLGGLSLKGQTFMYSYVDPCTQQVQTLMYDMSAPIIVSYYGQTRAFTYNEISSGVLDTWLNQVYSNFIASPCDEVFTTVTTTSTTNLTTNLVNSVLNLSAVTSISSMNLGGNINSTNSSNSNTNENNNNPQSNTTSSSNNSNNNNNSNNTGSPNNSNSGSGSSGGNSEPNSGGSNSSESSGGTTAGETQGESQEGVPSEEKIDEAKTEQQKTEANQTSKTTAKARTQVQKPAILVTGDIVGLQKTDDKTNDARGTFSFTRVKGDGTASFGLSADYMIRAKISNITLMKSWIGTTEKGNKHINLLSSGFSIQPGSWTNTTMFIRVNSLKRFTAIYGAAGSAGYLYKEPIISTLAVAGFMYKGKIYKNIDGTLITAAVYAPYSKYYTESWFDSKPIVIPFFNINYKLTKTFGVGLTGGGTYLAGANVLNYQVLLGSKLIL
jgi:hypothetical protein